MGTLGGGDGGRPPDNGGQPEGLPGLPPEWGTIVIPDDPAELATEAVGVRRELRRQRRRTRWRRRFGLAPPADGEGQTSLGLPLMIMTIAVLAALTSLFAVAWPGNPTVPPVEPPTGSLSARRLPDVTLLDSAGAPVRMREVAPAVILLVEGCACAELVGATARATTPGIPVLAIDRTAPSLAPPPTGTTTTVRALADPSSAIRNGLQLGPPNGAAAVVLVSRDGAVTHAVPAAHTLDAFRAELTKLAG